MVLLRKQHGTNFPQYLSLASIRSYDQQHILHLYSKIMLFSGASPTQALKMFSSIALCFESAFTTGVPGGTCFLPNKSINNQNKINIKIAEV